MKRIVVLKQGERKELAKIFKVSTRSVSYALSYERNGDSAVRIRQAALKRGNCIEVDQ